MAMGLHAFSRRGGAKRAPMAEINVTPFVDVMLVLLIIFMVTAPLLTSGVPVELPDSRAQALPAEQDDIALSMLADGTIYFGEDLVSEEQLSARLVSLSPDGEGRLPQVTLRADRTLSYGRVMAVMGELNRAGITQISLVTNSSVDRP